MLGVGGNIPMRYDPDILVVCSCRFDLGTRWKRAVVEQPGEEM